jgi:dTDP-4-dehydrorhamnose 3,5-epimerase-like enzyme
MDIEGVRLLPRKVAVDPRGKVLRMIRTDDPDYRPLQELYYSVVNPGVTKGWKLHTEATGSLAVPAGRLRFVMKDMRETSPTFGALESVVLGDTEEEYRLLVIPPGVAYAWQNLAETPSVVANATDVLWREGEGKTIPLEEIPFAW